MRFFTFFPVNNTQSAGRNRFFFVKRVFFALVVLALFSGCSSCRSCRIGSKRSVARPPSDVTDLSVVFRDGDAVLNWVDSEDVNLKHIEINWEPDGKKTKKVAKGVGEYLIPKLKEGVTYNFTVKAVDKQKNKSTTAVNGTGKAHKQQKSGRSSDIMGIKGTPIAGQATLSWTNLADSRYDHIEVYHDPNRETVYQVSKGVESKTLVGLNNRTEYTFYVAAVDARGNRMPVEEIGLFISDNATSPESVWSRSSGGQITLYWKDPFYPQYNGIEAVCSPGETPVSVARGKETVTFYGLSDLVDREFSVYTVDAAGRRRPITNIAFSASQTPLFDGQDAELTVAQGRPVTGQVTLEWTDPVMDNLVHIAVIYDPDGKNVPVIVQRGTETKTFSGLSDLKDYRFLAYGVDSQNNKRVIAGLNLSTPTLPRIFARPVSGRVRLAWENPEDPNLDHIELTYSPDRQTPVKAAQGAERYTFTGLSDYQDYEFRVNAVTTTENVYAVAARAFVTPLPVLIGTPVNRRLSIAWVDPTDITFSRIEIVYSPDGEQPRSVARGLETITIPNLANGTEYSFTIYALDDSLGNRHSVVSPKFYDPNVTVTLPPEPVELREDLGPLYWRASANTAFDSGNIHALSFGIVANGAGRWIAGGSDGKLAYSNNGLDWFPVGDSTFGSYSVDSIHFANSRWVATGKNGKIAWSNNGIIWNAVRRFDFAATFNINAVTFGNGRWMAGGSNGSIIVSEDNGVSWRLAAANVLGQSAINTIVFHAGRWMAGGTAGKIAYSDDNGLTWTAVGNNIFGNSAISVIVYDDGRWMAGGYTQRMAWSKDSITWQPMERPFYVLCMSFNGYRWIAGGQRGRMAWSIDGGDNWIVDEQSYKSFGENWIQAVAFGRTADGTLRWLAAGQSGKIIYADEERR